MLGFLTFSKKITKETFSENDLYSFFNIMINFNSYTKFNK